MEQGDYDYLQEEVLNAPASPAYDASTSQPTTSATDQAAPLKWERIRLHPPFLEEYNRKLFCRQIHKLSDETRFGAHEFKNPELRKEFVHMKKSCRHSESSSVLNSRIKSVDKVSNMRLRKLLYSEISITREDGSSSNINEADLEAMSPKDIYDLIYIFKRMTNRTGTVMDGYKAVQRYARHYINYICMHDFQLGLESHSEKVNLTRPDTEYEAKSESEQESSIITDPELGVLYKDKRNKLALMRVSQLNCFSDGTLSQVKSKLEKKVAAERLTVSGGKTSTSLNNLEDVLNKIVEKLEYRDRVRILEIALKLRKKYLPNRSTFALQVKGGEC